MSPHHGAAEAFGVRIRDTFTAPVTNYSAQVQILGAVGTAGSSYDLVFDVLRLQKY